MPLAFRLATFNLESLDDHPERGPPLERRIEILRPQLARLRADVLCLQEVNGQPSGRHAPRTLAALDRLLEGTPYATYARAHTKGEHGPYDVHNLITLSRFPIGDQAQIRHRIVPAPSYHLVAASPVAETAAPVEWDRPVLHTALDLGYGRTLHVINLHLRAPLAAFVPGGKTGPFTWGSARAWAEGFFLATMKRAGQALETRLFVDGLFDAERHALVAVAGDFNAEAREMPVRTLIAAEADTGNGDLAHRSLVSLEASVPESNRYSVVHGGRASLIDHVLVSRALLAHARGVEIHNESLFDEVSTPAVTNPPDSFHAPLVASFEVP